MYFIIMFYISSYLIITFCCTGCFITPPSTAGLSHRESASADTYSDSYRDRKEIKIYTVFCHILELSIYLKVCKSVHHHTIQINQPTRCNNFSSFLLDVYVLLNVFRASSRPSSGAQQLQ